MKLASGFCIPEPLPMHTSIKGRQVHPLSRFCFGAEWMRSVLISTSLSSLICSWLASRCSQRSPSQQQFPWALQLKEKILKEQITDGHVFFKMPFCPCPFGCGRFLSADDGHDRCLQCLGFQHTLKMRSWTTHAPVVERYLWLNLAEMKDVEKARFLDAPISQAGLFGDTVEGFAQQFSAVQQQTEAIQQILPRRDALTTAARP